MYLTIVCLQDVGDVQKVSSSKASDGDTIILSSDEDEHMVSKQSEVYY